MQAAGVPGTLLAGVLRAKVRKRPGRRATFFPPRHQDSAASAVITTEAPHRAGPSRDSRMVESPEAARIRQIVDAWEGRLTAYARRFLGGDLERARDVVQDTFLRLWQADRPVAEESLPAWLYRVCRNRAIDVQRKDGRMVRTDESMLAAEAASDPAAEAAAAGEGPSLLAAVAGLPPRQQEAVRLRFQGGLSYADIAGVMDTSVSNVGVLLHVAMRTLRERLGSEPGSAAVHGKGGAA